MVFLVKLNTPVFHISGQSNGLQGVIDPFDGDVALSRLNQLYFIKLGELPMNPAEFTEEPHS